MWVSDKSIILPRTRDRDVFLRSRASYGWYLEDQGSPDTTVYLSLPERVWESIFIKWHKAVLVIAVLYRYSYKYSYCYVIVIMQCNVL